MRRRKGACVFLDRKLGCCLPAEIRPTACRLYPFELWPDGGWGFQVERYGSLESAASSGGAACLAVEEAGQMEDVLAAFEVTRQEVQRLGEQLKAEVARHARGDPKPKHKGGRSGGTA